jgi:heat shock protein HslJ
MTVRRFAGFLGLLVGLAGCGSASAPGPSASGTAQLPLGRTFKATGASEGGRDRPLAARASIEFAASGTTSVETGCNTATTKAQLRDGKLVSLDGFIITAKGCSQRSVTDQQQFVMGVVTTQPEVILDGDVLLLRGATAEIRFQDRRVADPDRPLEGTRWRVTGTFDPQVGTSLADPQGELILSGGLVRYTGPCNDLQGPAAVIGETITFGPLTAGTSRPCGQDQQRSQSSVDKVLAGQVRATVASNALRLEQQDGTGVSLVEVP